MGAKEAQSLLVYYWNSVTGGDSVFSSGAGSSLGYGSRRESFSGPPDEASEESSELIWFLTLGLSHHPQSLLFFFSFLNQSKGPQGIDECENDGR